MKFVKLYVHTVKHKNDKIRVVLDPEYMLCFSLRPFCTYLLIETYYFDPQLLLSFFQETFIFK